MIYKILHLSDQRHLLDRSRCSVCASRPPREVPRRSSGPRLRPRPPRLTEVRMEGTAPCRSRRCSVVARAFGHCARLPRSVQRHPAREPDYLRRAIAPAPRPHPALPDAVGHGRECGGQAQARRRRWPPLERCTRRKVTSIGGHDEQWPMHELSHGDCAHVLGVHRRDRRWQPCLSRFHSSPRTGIYGATNNLNRNDRYKNVIYEIHICVRYEIHI